MAAEHLPPDPDAEGLIPATSAQRSDEDGILAAWAWAVYLDSQQMNAELGEGSTNDDRR